MSVNVVVNLGVSTGATGTVDVFGQTVGTVTNKVVASLPMPYTVLYGGPGTGLIEFQGRNNDIVARTVSEFTQNLDNKPALTTALQLILTAGNLDATAAAPFNTPAGAPYGAGVLKYSDSSYRNYKTIGELGLGLYAHVFFGHVDATAAIDNDTTFITLMNGTDEMAGQANLSGKLANLIFALSDAQCTSIAKQVIGQDASRAFSADNDNAGVDAWQKLAFKPGDKVYVSITFTRPTVTTSNAAQQRKPSNLLFISPMTYMIEITLEDPALLG